jgi:hypothetical protein
LWYAFFISTAEEEGSIPLKEEKCIGQIIVGTCKLFSPPKAYEIPLLSHALNYFPPLLS